MKERSKAPAGMPEDDVAVSVIIPVYNLSSYIQDCIASLKRQSLKRLEFIFVDDCSTDDSVAVIEAFAGEDSRVRLLRSPDNQGAGPARNRGIDAAVGEYLSFIDPDDWISDDFYELLYQRAVQEDRDIVKGMRVSVSEGENPEKAAPGILNKMIIRSIRKKVPLYASFTFEHQSAIYRRKLFENDDVRYGSSRVSQDTTFLLRICSRTENISVISGPVYYYRQRPGAATSGNTLRRSAGELDAIREKLEYFQKKPELPMAAAYIQQKLERFLSDLYFAYRAEPLSETDVESFAEQLNRMADRFGKRLFPLELISEANVFLQYNYLIPIHRIPNDPAYRERFGRWSEFLAAHPEPGKKSYLRIYALLLLWRMFYLFRCGDKGARKAETAFSRQQFSLLRGKEKRMVVLMLPSVALDAAVRKIQDFL